MRCIYDCPVGEERRGVVQRVECLWCVESCRDAWLFVASLKFFDFVGHVGIDSMQRKPGLMGVL